MNCLSILCALYLDAGVMAIAKHAPPQAGYWYPFERNRIANPYGVLALGLEYDFTARLAARFELRHESSITTPNDCGEDSAGVYLRWRPFRN